MPEIIDGEVWAKFGELGPGQRPPLSFRTGLTSHPGLCRYLLNKHHTQLDRESRNACSAAFFFILQRLKEIYREAKG